MSPCNSYWPAMPSWALFLALIPLLVSCGQESAPLNIASSPWPGYEPLYLARDIGYLPQEKANLYELPSADVNLESFRNHSADMATITLDEAIELISSGIKFRILVVMDSSNGADSVMASPGVKTVADLKGKRIAILNIPLGVYMLTRTLNKAQLTRKDVFVIPSSEARHPEMYKQGKADAFITFEPFKSELARMGAHVIFDSSQIPDEIFDLMVVHEDVYQSRRQEVCEVAQQWFNTLEYIRQAPDDAAARMGKRLGVTAQDYRKMAAGIITPTLADNLRLLAGNAPAIVAPAHNLVNVMLAEGQLKKHVAIDSALDSGLAGCIAR
jgi:NitT/TauT family transport system substrate-binding protein